ncbi:MAG: L,D-transpeptidase [Bacteroidales bacterium]|nr:L,D-transpeptidase [Bacteroidales bacterium]
MTWKKLGLYVLLLIVIVLPYIGFFYVVRWYKQKVEKIEKAAVIIIDKEKLALSLIDYNGATRMTCPIACGKNYGNKEKQGDMKTPEGVFHVSDIQDASDWKHDFHDGKGEIAGAYGPFFIRLDTPGHKGIGIHGTHLPESIGTRATEGCVRLKNEDLLELKKNVYVGMSVIITPSSKDASSFESADSQ